MFPTDLEDKSASELKTLANRLRTEYKMFKDEHPLQQSEEIINQFLLIKEALKKKKDSLPSKDTVLDRDARALGAVAKIKPIPLLPTKMTFGSPKIQIFSTPEAFTKSLEKHHTCVYCGEPASIALVIDEGKSFIPVCMEHKIDAYLDLD